MGHQVHLQEARAGVASGAALAFSGALAELSPIQAFAFGCAAYLPTLVQVRYQRYWFKMLSRFSLGIGIVLALSAALFGGSWLSWTVLQNLLFLAIFIGLYLGTVQWRAKHLDVPCTQCPEGSFPFCSWRRAEIRAALLDHERAALTLPEPVVAFLRVLDDDLAESQRAGTASSVTFVRARSGV